MQKWDSSALVMELCIFDFIFVISKGIPTEQVLTMDNLHDVIDEIICGWVLPVQTEPQTVFTPNCLMICSLFHQCFSLQDWNTMKLSFCSKTLCDNIIVTNFCTCHDICAVMACAKYCSNLTTLDWFTTKSFCWVLIVSENWPVKWVSGQVYGNSLVCK